MAIELATAWVSIVPSTRGLSQQLNKELVGPLGDAGTEASESFTSSFTGRTPRIIQGAGLAIAGVFAASLAKGFGRLKAIDDARFKLQGLGHDTATVDAIMQNALDSVLGTAFGLGEAATISATLVAAGIKPGQELERTLRLTGDAATIAGTSLDDMGDIFGVIAAGGSVTGLELRRLRQRGIPIVQMLADELGTTADEVTAMVSRGEVDFATFQRAIETNIGGAALTAGESFSGLLANMGAALGRFGAAILGPAFSAAPGVFGAITGALDLVTKATEPLVELFAGPLAIGFAVVGTAIAAVLVPALIAWGVTSTISAARTVTAWTVAQLTSIRSAAVQVLSAGRVVAGWALMGIQSLLHAAKVAAAWVISMGPIGIVIAAVVGLVAVVIKNWDKIKRAITTAAQAVIGWLKDNWPLILAILTGPIGLAALAIVRNWDKIKDGVSAVKDWIVEKWDDVIGFLTGLPGRIGTAVSGMWDGVKDAFRAAINWIIDRWNSFRFEIGGWTIPGPGPIPDVTLPTITVDMPNIPRLAEGGIVRRPTLALLGEAGPEAVVPLGAGGFGSGDIYLTLDLGEGIERRYQISQDRHDRWVAHELGAA